MKAIAILNLKGGVGKTVTAVNMAHILHHRRKQKVLLIDCDSQCNATEFLGVEPADGAPTLADILTGAAEPLYTESIWPTTSGIDLIPASDALMDLDLTQLGQHRVDGGALRDVCEAIRDDDAYDYVIFDCPPAFNAASAAALAAADEVIVPIKLDAFSLRGLANVCRQVDNMRRVNPKIRIAGALITMWQNTPAMREAEESLRACGVLPVFRQKIRRSAKVDEATFSGGALPVYSPHCGAGIDYRLFVWEWLRREGEHYGQL